MHARPMPKPDTSPALDAHVTWTVGVEDCASRLSRDPSDVFPEVFATSRMVAIMELAAARCLAPILAEGELSVGVGVDVTHAAATLPGDTVTATASYLGMQGKLHAFDVVARDGGGEIGRCRHTRAIITTARLLEGAAKRAKRNA